MTTIIDNNENKTDFTFEYNNGLPYKKSIRPEYEYGDWEKNKQIALFKINLNNEELNLFKDKNNIDFHLIRKINNEIWIDLDDVYLILKSNSYVDEKIQNKKFVLGFFENKKLLSSSGFTK